MSDQDSQVELEAQALEFEASLLVGTFDASKVPDLPTHTFQAKGPWVAAAGPDASYEVLSQAIQSAQKTLDIYIYNITGTSITDLILARLAAGVQARIMYDAGDSRGGEADRIKALQQAGAAVRKAPSVGPGSVFTVCHQKLCIADNSTTCLGSGNWGPSAFPSPVPATYTKCNREWVITVADGELARWWTALFDADWELAGAAQPTAADLPLEAELADTFLPAAKAKPPGPFAAHHHAGGLTRMTPIPSPDSYMPKVQKLIEGAKHRILIQQQYILLSGPSVRDLLGRVRARAEQGVEVRVIVSPQFRKVGKTDNWELSQKALAAYEMEHRLRAMNINVFTHLHNKGLVVDDSVVISSTNWSDNSLSRGREAGLIVEDKALADYFTKIFDADWAIAWPSADVQPNVAELFLDAATTPGGLVAMSSADIF